MERVELNSEAILKKLLTTYKAVASPVFCPYCGASPAEKITTIEPDKVFRCQSCGKDYILKKNLDEKTVDQIVSSILKDFTKLANEEFKSNLNQVIALYHQYLIDEMEGLLEKGGRITFSAIQDAYRKVDENFFLVLKNVQDLRGDMKQLSTQQAYFISKSQEQYQNLLQQIQLIVTLIRQLNGSSYYKPADTHFSGKSEKKLKHTDFNPEEFAPV